MWRDPAAARDRSLQCTREIDLISGSVAEAEPDHVTADVARFDDVVIHHDHNAG
jgi:hypothetical protein